MNRSFDDDKDDLWISHAWHDSSVVKMLRLNGATDNVSSDWIAEIRLPIQ